MLALTVGFVLLAELLIFPPSAANFCNNWLRERIQAAEIAALALEAAPDRMVSAELAKQLLEKAEVMAVAVGEEDMRELIFSPQTPLAQDPVRIDLRGQGRWNAMTNTLGHMLAPPGRYLQVIDNPRMAPGAYVDVIVPEASLKQELLAYSLNILFLSLVISALTGGLVYFAVYWLVVRPMMQITQEVSRFGEAPDQMTPIQPSGRRDEFGRAEYALRDMQTAVANSLRQKKRLADLGEAVAKISHDLRNSLAVAQLASDAMSRSDDPQVRRAAPRLERAIERAISLAQATLRYGRADPVQPVLRSTPLRACVEEAIRDGLAAAPEVDWINEIDEAMTVQTDAEQLHRIIANLARNAGQAIAAHREGRPELEAGLVAVRATNGGAYVEIELEDNGPGVPERAQERLFQAFSASSSKDGSGLGLAIARELAQALGGDVNLTRSNDAGAVFTVRLRVS